MTEQEFLDIPMPDQAKPKGRPRGELRTFIEGLDIPVHEAVSVRLSEEVTFSKVKSLVKNVNKDLLADGCRYDVRQVSEGEVAIACLSTNTEKKEEEVKEAVAAA